MNYSTFDLYNFFIKKDSTLPELKFPLVQQLREQYDISDSMLENVAVTFSMIDAMTGLYRIANVAGNLVIVNDLAAHPDEEKYTLTYRFKLPQTAKAGRYLANFTLDFLGENCGKIGLPVNGYINIIISDSTTKTTVI
jgi:hypothetical protein